MLEHLDPGRDTWIAQAEFARRNRRLVNLLRLGLPLHVVPSFTHFTRSASKACALS